MMLRRNVAGQVFTIPGALISTVDGTPVTSGSITIQKDGVDAAGAGTLTHISNGAFKYTPTAGETDCNIMGYILTGTNAMAIAGSCETTVTNPQDPNLGLANLDAQVSSRSTYAGGDTSGTTTLLSRLSSGRATNLDNLDATVSSRSTYAGGAVASVTSPVTVGTNNDKTGYGLSSSERSTLAGVLDLAIINQGDGADLISAIANAIAADWVAGDASPLAVVAALTANSTFVQLVADAAAAKVAAQAAPTAIQIRQEMDSNSTKLAAAATESNATTNRTTITNAIAALPTPPTVVQIRQEMDANSTRLSTIASLVAAIRGTGALGIDVAIAMLLQPQFNDAGDQVSVTTEGDETYTFPVTRFPSNVTLRAPKSIGPGTLAS